MTGSLYVVMIVFQTITLKSGDNTHRLPIPGCAGYMKVFDNYKDALSAAEGKEDLVMTIEKQSG